MASTSIQTVPSSFTSAFSKPQPVYDVFLSFRGDDTCFRFTDHLYHALVDKEIITFRDDKELKMGEPISLELLEAIEKSRIAIIIFSENYASSTWCLEELAKIFECRDRGILRVLPIFYHVEPADVRDQKNTFAEAFAKHEKRFEENPKKVQKWRAALTNVANLSGERLKDGVHEANFIRSIVQWIYSKLREKLSNNIEDDLVGISPNDLRGELKSHSQLSRLYQQSFFLDKSSGKKCYLLAARELSIEWGFTPKYWRWISLPEESRFPEVAELNRVYWFDIRGKMSTSILSPKTRYAAYLVYKLRSGAHGFDGPPFKASVGTVGGEVYEQTVRLDLFVMEPNQQDQIIPLPQQHTSRPKQREDGWLEIELGQFFNGEGEDDELQIKLREIEALNEKTGLVVEGIEIRPTKG
ncbi:F-box protein PP2-B1-like isoform X4 [Quercus lobata]|nr:F-box protein PP2-B1-like isoform X4 [Quercus lobata]